MNLTDVTTRTRDRTFPRISLILGLGVAVLALAVLAPWSAKPEAPSPVSPSDDLLSRASHRPTERTLIYLVDIGDPAQQLALELALTESALLDGGSASVVLVEDEAAADSLLQVRFEAGLTDTFANLHIIDLTARTKGRTAVSPSTFGSSTYAGQEVAEYPVPTEAASTQSNALTP